MIAPRSRTPDDRADLARLRRRDLPPGQGVIPTFWRRILEGIEAAKSASGRLSQIKS